MIKSYQDRRDLEREAREPRDAQLATVGSVYQNGITLIFDGETQPTSKRFKRNSSANFSAGQRVKVCKIGGTYIVEYPIG